MKSCFMFGHSDCPESILPRIEQAIVNCYLKGVTDFYVGCRGQFDSLAAKAVIRVKQQYKEVRLYLLLAYHPGERPVDLRAGFDGSYYPPLENVPRPFAIIQGNQYMVNNSDYLICYVEHTGNTRKLLEYAQKRKEEGSIENVAIASDTACGSACSLM